MKKSLEKHVIATYFSLRIGVAVIVILFPVLLWLGGLFYAGLPLQDSMSAYYHASLDGKSMRNWFVGILFAVGVILYLYKGYSANENYALNFAGVLAVCIAIFPMSLNCGDSCSKYSVHGISAVLFFICIAFVCVFCSRDTLRLIQNETIRLSFRRLYQSLAAAMILSPILALAINILFRQYSALVFYVEAFGIFAFAAYWLTKSKELSISQAEKRALRGELET